MKRNKVVIAISWLLAALFVYAAVNKLMIYKTFVLQLQNAPATKNYAPFLSWFVPASELIVSALLIIPAMRLMGLYSAFFMMMAFTIYVYVVPHFFKQGTCSCGGIISGFSWKQHFWFNLAFFLLAAIGLSLLPQKQRLTGNRLTNN